MLETIKKTRQSIRAEKEKSQTRRTSPGPHDEITARLWARNRRGHADEKPAHAGAQGIKDIAVTAVWYRRQNSWRTHPHIGPDFCHPTWTCLIHKKGETLTGSHTDSGCLFFCHVLKYILHQNSQHDRREEIWQNRITWPQKTIGNGDGLPRCVHNIRCVLSDVSHMPLMVPFPRRFDSAWALETKGKWSVNNENGRPSVMGKGAG
jgi:hypothetical protein